jgi:hypothetical protein
MLFRSGSEPVISNIWPEALARRGRTTPPTWGGAGKCGSSFVAMPAVGGCSVDLATLRCHACGTLHSSTAVCW